VLLEILFPYLCNVKVNTKIDLGVCFLEAMSVAALVALLVLWLFFSHRHVIF